MGAGGASRTFVWKQQQECSIREIIKLVEEICNAVERTECGSKMYENMSLLLYCIINFSLG
jgi:hypothetical protein